MHRSCTSPARKAAPEPKSGRSAASGTTPCWISAYSGKVRLRGSTHKLPGRRRPPSCPPCNTAGASDGAGHPRLLPLPRSKVDDARPPISARQGAIALPPPAAACRRHPLPAPCRSPSPPSFSRGPLSPRAPERGGNPELVRESQRRRYADVSLVDKVLELDAKWREGGC